MARGGLRIEGLSDLEDALRELPKATGKNVLKRTLTNAGEPIARSGEANAPRLSGELATSYTVGTKLSRRQKRLHKKESAVEVFVGPTPHAKSVQTEFGNAHQGPKPHMRPAWDGNRQKSAEMVRDELASEIEKARQRLARKAAREIAKMTKS